VGLRACGGSHSGPARLRREPRGFPKGPPGIELSGIELPFQAYGFQGVNGSDGFSMQLGCMASGYG